MSPAPKNLDPRDAGRLGSAGAGEHTRIATAYTCANGAFRVTLKDGSDTGLKDPADFVGYDGDPLNPASILLKHHGLHIELVIDRTRRISGSEA